MKRIILLVIAAAMLAAGSMDAKKMSELRVYINPGHGGYDSDDRPMHLYPFAKGDTAGFWESKSNLYKGLHMYHILDSLGATVKMSRVKNTTADDRGLKEIDLEANNWKADIFFSIHSDAGENTNYPLMLYREDRDANGVPYPRYEGNVTLSEILAANIYSDQLPVWTHKPKISGDLTFGMYTTGYGILRNLYVVGVLAEYSHHAHYPEAYRLLNDDYLWLSAWHSVKTIMEYFDTEDRFVTGNVAGVVYDDHNLREKDMTVTFSCFGRDKLAPVNGCYIELLDGSGNVVQKRTTDNVYNGVYVFRNVTPGTYTLRTSHDQYYVYEKTVEVKANEVTYNDIPLMMRRESPLEVVKYSPNVAAEELVSCASTIDFEFNYDIDTEAFEQAFSISPAVEGYFTYSNNNHNASFCANRSLDPNTNYTVTLAASAKHPDSRYEHPQMNEDLVFSFTTQARSFVELLSYYPTENGDIHYEEAILEFRFDNKLDKATVINGGIKITDSKGNEVAYNTKQSKFNTLSNNYGNATLILSNNLTVGETYTVTISEEVRDRENLPLAAGFTYTFTAVDATKNVDGSMTVFNDFETEAPFTYSAEASVGVAAATPKCAKSTSVKLFDTASARFTYAYEDQRNGSIVWDYTGDEVLALETTSELGMFINGDFNNHELYAGISTGSDIIWLKVCDLNFTGWKYFNVSLSELDPTFPYVFAGFKLVQVQSLITQKGNFAIDNFSVKGQSGITDIIIDEPAEDATYFNLQGIEVAQPQKGFFIEHRGTQSRKVIIR